MKLSTNESAVMKELDQWEVLSVAHLKTCVPRFIFHSCLPGLVKEQTQQRGKEAEIDNFFNFVLEQDQTVNL